MAEVDDLEKFVTESVQDCIEENERALKENCEETGNRAVKLLKQRSRARSGTYRKGWKADTQPCVGGTETVVHNRWYTLPHLLENGHAIANQYGTFPGEVQGDHVIEEVAKECEGQFGRIDW